jgi:predicted RNA-binding Zn-ribbon protein involved in translation (DUF1610 family)
VVVRVIRNEASERGTMLGLKRNRKAVGALLLIAGEQARTESVCGQPARRVAAPSTQPSSAPSADVAADAAADATVDGYPCPWCGSKAAPGQQVCPACGHKVWRSKGLVPGSLAPIPPAKRGELIVTNPEKAPLWQHLLLLLYRIGRYVAEAAKRSVDGLP